MIEYDVIVEEMPRMLRCRYIAQEDVLAGRWADGVEALLAQPAGADHANDQRRRRRGGVHLEDGSMIRAAG